MGGEGFYACWHLPSMSGRFSSGLVRVHHRGCWLHMAHLLLVPYSILALVTMFGAKSLLGRQSVERPGPQGLAPQPKLVVLPSSLGLNL